jgi:hypothetical protein
MRAHLTAAQRRYRTRLVGQQERYVLDPPRQTRIHSF